MSQVRSHKRDDDNAHGLFDTVGLCPVPVLEEVADEEAVNFSMEILCGPPEFFTIWPFFRKFLSNRPLAKRIPEMDPWLGARVSGAELGSTVTGAELLATGKRPARGSAAPERMAPSSAP